MVFVLSLVGERVSKTWDWPSTRGLADRKIQQRRRGRQGDVAVPHPLIIPVVGVA
jgi:hypothetical protein